jgi:hypothetical protein
LPLARLRKWVKAQEDAIEQARSVAAKALDAGDLALCLAALQLVTRTQGELIALVVPKKAAAKSKSAAEAKSAESEAEEDAVPITSEPLPDVSAMTDEELERIVAEGAVATEVTPVWAISKPASRPRGRSKGYEASGAAKLAKERAQGRREREQREREGRASIPCGAMIALSRGPHRRYWRNGTIPINCPNSLPGESLLKPVSVDRLIAVVNLAASS